MIKIATITHHKILRSRVFFMLMYMFREATVQCGKNFFGIARRLTSMREACAILLDTSSRFFRWTLNRFEYQFIRS